jgi:protein phosphatase PTC2/3
LGNNNGSGPGGYRGRIIFLGDGSEVLTDSEDTEMLDHSEEDKDLASQVSKPTSDKESAPDDANMIGDEIRVGEAKVGESGDTTSESQSTATETDAKDKEEQPSEHATEATPTKAPLETERTAGPTAESTKSGASDTPSDASEK